MWCQVESPGRLGAFLWGEPPSLQERGWVQAVGTSSCGFVGSPTARVTYICIYILSVDIISVKFQFSTAIFKIALLQNCNHNFSEACFCPCHNSTTAEMIFLKCQIQTRYERNRHPRFWKDSEDCKGFFFPYFYHFFVQNGTPSISLNWNFPTCILHYFIPWAVGMPFSTPDIYPSGRDNIEKYLLASIIPLPYHILISPEPFLKRTSCRLFEILKTRV